MGTFIVFFNSFLNFVKDVGKSLVRFIFVVIGVLALCFAFYWSIGFLNFQLMGVGYLLMPIAESHNTLAGAGIGTQGQAAFIWNTYVADPGTEIIQCIEELGVLWNRLVAFAKGVLRRVLEGFDINVPQWDMYRGGDTSIPSWSYLTYMNEQADRAGPAPNPDEIHRLALEAKARFLAIRIARVIDPKGERINVAGLINTVCKVLRSVPKFLIDVVLIVSDFGFTLYDLLISIVGPLFEDGDITGVRLLVKAIIQVILDILDPCKCFGGFPNNFPKSIFKCICFFTYKSDDEVPNNALNALVGCLCPGFNLFGNFFDDMIRPCLRMPYLEWLLTVIETLINLAMEGIRIVRQIIDGVLSAIRWIQRVIRRIRRLFSRGIEFGSLDGKYWYKTELIANRNGEDIYMLHKYVNATGEHLETFESRVEFGGIPSLDDMPEIQNLQYVDEAQGLWEEIVGYQSASRETYRIHTEPMRMMGNFMNNMRKIQRDLAEEDWTVEVARGLPEIPCPLPIDTSRGMDRAAERDAAMRSLRWEDYTKGLKSYFLSDVADRVHLGLIHAAVGLANATTLPPEAEHLARKLHQTTPRDLSLIVQAGKMLAKEFLRVVAAPRDVVITEHEVKNNLADLPVLEAHEAVTRTARKIREFHGWAPEAEILTRMSATAVVHPFDLVHLVREYGTEPVNIPSLEYTLGKIEERVGRLEEARAAHQAGNDELAYDHMRKAVLGHRASNYTAAFGRAYDEFVEGPKKTGRIFGAGIAVTIGVGGAITLTAGLLIGAVIAGAPILGLLVAVLAILAVFLLGPLFDVALTGLETILNGGDPAGFDPIASAIYIIGPAIVDTYQAGPQPPGTFAEIGKDFLDLQVDNLEHFATLAIRALLKFALPFVTPPKPTYDPLTGASTMGLVRWVKGIIDCEDFVECQVSGSASCFGECVEPIGGGEFTRECTEDNPCQLGYCSCYPRYRTGRFIRRWEVSDDEPRNCKTEGFDTSTHLIKPNGPGIWTLTKTWATNWWQIVEYIMGLAAAGKAIPLPALAFYFVPSLCFCVRPFAAIVWRATAFTNVLAIFWPTIAEWWRDTLFADKDLWLVGGAAESLLPLFTPRELDFEMSYCSFFFIGALLWFSGWLLTLAPALVFSVALGFKPFFTFVLTVLLWPANIIFWLVRLIISNARYESWMLREAAYRTDTDPFLYWED